MKIKIGESWGTAVDRDLDRVRQLRDLAEPGVDLMIDANGGYTRGQAVRRSATRWTSSGVVWFEEPVSSDDQAGLAGGAAALRLDVAAGEYASDLDDVRRLCGAVDCVQLDVTRCGGFTGWLRGAAVAQSHHLDVSGHCAPSSPAPWRTCAMSSGSPTTRASNHCCWAGCYRCATRPPPRPRRLRARHDLASRRRPLRSPTLTSTSPQTRLKECR